MVSSTRAGVGPFSAKQNLAVCLRNKSVQKENKEGREERMNEWKRFQKGLESCCSDSPSPWNELRSRSRSAPAYGREWRNNKALRNDQKKGENGEKKTSRRKRATSLQLL